MRPNCARWRGGCRLTGFWWRLIPRISRRCRIAARPTSRASSNTWQKKLPGNAGRLSRKTRRRHPRISSDCSRLPGRGPMFKAARRIAIILLLTGGTAVAGVYEDMLHAVNNDDEQTVAQLLKRGVDVNTVDANGDSLLALAARRGKPEMVKTVLDARPRVNSRNSRGETALMLATFNGHTDAVRALLAQGAEFNHSGWNPLIYAAARNRMDIARILIGRGAQVDGEAENGTTALMMAAREGHLQMVLLLLEHGANINHKTKSGYSALTMAKDKDRREIV